MINSMQKLLDFLAALKKKNINYSIEHNREETIMVLIAVPGERWEVEFFADGKVEVEVFKGYGHIKGETELERLFKEYSE